MPNYIEKLLLMYEEVISKPDRDAMHVYFYLHILLMKGKLWHDPDRAYERLEWKNQDGAPVFQHMLGCVIMNGFVGRDVDPVMGAFRMREEKTAFKPRAILSSSNSPSDKVSRARERARAFIMILNYLYLL